MHNDMRDMHYCDESVFPLINNLFELTNCKTLAMGLFSFVKGYFHFRLSISLCCLKPIS